MTLVACGLVACRGTSPALAVPDAARIADGGASTAAAAAGDPALAQLWAQAASGEGGDLARLADREGAAGLVERAQDGGAPRATAVRAMAYAPEPGAFVALPYLAEVARGADDALAQAALESVIELAARPRRALDPEDAAELKAGCDALLALAADADGSSALRSAHAVPGSVRARRVNAIRALRMLADRGCADPRAIPSDVDAR